MASGGKSSVCQIFLLLIIIIIIIITAILIITLMKFIIRAGGGMESVCQSEGISFTSPLPPVAGQVLAMMMMMMMCHYMMIKGPLGVL